MLAISLPALVFGLGCGALYSLGDYFRKAAPADCRPETIMFYYVAGQIPALAAWVWWTGETHLSPGYFIPGAIDAIFGLGANLLFIVSIRRSPLSLMIPLLSLVPVATLLMGGVLLGEWPTPRQSTGIVLVALGLLILFQPPDLKPGFLSAWSALRTERGTAPMAVVVMLWATTPALDKLCLAHAGAGLHGLLQVAAIWSALLVWALVRRSSALKLPRGAAHPVAGAALAGAGGYALQLLAYSAAAVAVVEVLKRSVALLSSLILGRAAFREPLTAPKVAGAAIIILGLALVMLV